MEVLDPIFEWLRLKESSGGQPEVVQPPARSCRTGCLGPCTGGFWVSLRRETPSSGTPVLHHPHGKRSVSWYSDRTSYISFFARCLLTCHWALQKRTWLLLLYTHPSDIYAHWWDPPEHSLLQPKRSQFSWYLLRREVLLSIHHLTGPLVLSTPIRNTLTY